MIQMSVFFMPKPRKYYLLHPIKRFRDKAVCRGRALQRAWLGYCVKDLDDVNEWFCGVMSGILSALKSSDSPHPKQFRTPEAWHEFLDRMSGQLERSTAGYYIEHEMNDFAEEYAEIVGKETLTNKEKILRRKYLTRQKEIDDNRRTLFQETMKELLPYWDYLKW